MPTTTAPRRFALPIDRLLPGSAASLSAGAATSADVLRALINDEPFPPRPIELGHVDLEAEAAAPTVKFDSGKGAVSFSASGSARMQIGVFDMPGAALAALDLTEAETAGLDLAAAAADEPATRLAVFSAGYEARVEAAGSHPIGVVGSVRFGVEGDRRRAYGIVHRFPAARGARTVLEGLFSSFRLPRHVESAKDLAPGTMIVSEVTGSIAVQIGAQLGYDFSFVREAKALGLTGDVGLRIETGLKATLGLQSSGRYLVAVERASLKASSNVVRVRLFKLSHKGWDFGMNLAATARTEVGILPADVDDLAKAVFGLHGRQVITDLRAIESKWLSPDTDLSDTVAGLTRKTALDLLKHATGVNPSSSFAKARGLLMDALARWERLPEKVSAALWRELEAGGLTGDRRRILEDALAVLASNDEDARRDLIKTALAQAGFDKLPLGQLLVAAADRGLAALIERSADLRPVAQSVLDLLNGGIIERLPGFIARRLNLDSLLGAATEGDFKNLDEWLVRRLSLFLDKQLGFRELEEAKAAVAAFLARRQEIYDRARQALERRYDLDFAARYQAATTRTALLDIEFDTSKAAARELLRTALADAGFDRIFIEQAPGVTLRTAVLTHELERKASVEVSLPYYSFRGDSLVKSLGRVTAREEGGRVLFYELEASDRRSIRNRLTGRLSVAAAIPVSLGAAVRRHTVADASWTYRVRAVYPNLRRAEFEHRLAPILGEYFGAHFAAGGPASISTFISELDRTVEQVVDNGPDEFGDVLASLELSVPARAVAAWFRPRTRDEVRAAARAVSLRLQRSLRRVLPYFYFQDPGRLRQDGAGSPILVWSALPARNQFQLRDGREVAGKGVFWDVFDPAKRAFLVSRPETSAVLGEKLAAARNRLLAAGRAGQAAFFQSSEIGDFLRGVPDSGNFVNLLSLESRVSRKVEEALDDVRGFFEKSEKEPSKAIAALAALGEDLTSAFHGTLANVYGGEATRVLGSMLFVEGACALDDSLAVARPTALLALTVLNEERAFAMPDYLDGEIPAPADIALEQRLLE